MLRKLFYNLGGMLPVWLIHPGQIILALERWLVRTVFKGATLPKWWTPTVSENLIAAIGLPVPVGVCLCTLLAGPWVLPNPTRIWVQLYFVFGVGGGSLASFAVFLWLACIWSWRHWRVQFQDTADDRGIVCVVLDDDDFETDFLHWFWGPTPGTRNWRFQFDVERIVKERYPTICGLQVVDRNGHVEVFDVGRREHEIVNPNENERTARAMLKQARLNEFGNWATVFRTLAVDGMFRQANHETIVSEMRVKCVRDEMEASAWRLVLVRLHEYFANTRSTQRDKAIAMRLARVEQEVVKTWIATGAGMNGRSLVELFDALDWPPLGKRAVKRSPTASGDSDKPIAS